jgi:hypothetical protein
MRGVLPALLLTLTVVSGCRHVPALLLEPGVGVRGEIPATWKLDLREVEPEVASDLAAGLSTRLYGTGEPGLGRPLEFVIRSPRPSAFSFRLKAASVGGATLDVMLDGRLLDRLMWEAAAQTHRPNTLYWGRLPRGDTTVRLRARHGVVVIDQYAFRVDPDRIPEGAVELGKEKNGMDADTRQVDGYRGIWFTLGQFYAPGQDGEPYVLSREPVFPYGDKYSGGLGTYTAKHVPLAIYCPEVEKTFFVYGGTTAADKRYLLCMASCYDHRTGRVPRPTVVHDKLGVDDPHDDPSISVDDEGHVWVFVSGRGRGRPGFKYRSLEPYSVSAFEQVTEEEMTYPQPWHVPGRGFLHLFTKYTGVRELYFESSVDGRAWTEDRKLAGIREPGHEHGGHYQTSARRGELVGTFFNRHPNGNVDRRTDLYYAQTPDLGQTWETVDGTPLSVPLTEVASPARAVDYASQGLNVYLKDMDFDRRGRPVLLYVTSPGHQPGPPNDPREFRLTRWDGNRWLTSVVCGCDHNYDMGSLYLGDTAWRVLVPSDPGPQPYHCGGELCWWRSIDQGRTWTLERQVTRDSPRNHNYVRRPQNARNPFFAFWADGDPTALSPSHLYFTDSTGEHVWTLPYTMSSDEAVPEPVP